VIVLGLCLVGASLAACTDSDSSSASSARSAGASVGQGTPSRDAATRALQEFVDSWRADGFAAASRTYLVANQQVDQGGSAPVLAAGTVAKVRNGPAGTGDALVLDVDLDLTFSGAGGAWHDGINERFVTFTPRGGAVPYVLSIAAAR
jgi:hypothetical protein